jgi:hypothetical protein
MQLILVKIKWHIRQNIFIVSFLGTAACVFLLPHWSFLHWENKIVSVSGHFRNFFWSASLLIVIIVSKVFMSKACMVVSGISCHCIWTNTDYYKQTKKVPPCLIKIFGNWPEKLIKWKYLIQKFQDICLSYYFNTKPVKGDKSST